MTPSAIWIVFSLSFLLSMSGAIMPGPLLTYTIARTMETTKRGFLIGPRVIVGHAALELLILVGLALGVAQFLKTPLIIKVIGVLGALLLGYMGIGLLREVFKKHAAVAAGHGAAGPGAPGPVPGSTIAAIDEKPSLVGRLDPIVAGALVSMSNPYWWVWWLTVGSATMIRFGVTLQAWQGLLAFFLGHEAGDFAWYSAVSTLTHFGRRTLSERVYNVILAVCGVAIIGFGAYLGISLFVRGA